MPTRWDWFATHDGARDTAAQLIEIVRDKMSRHHVLWLRSVVTSGDPMDYWLRVGSALGSPVTITEDGDTGEQKYSEGVWSDIRFRPNRPDSFRYHNVGQPLHTDGAYLPEAETGELILFYMAKQAQVGGDSQFIDAETLAAHAEAEAPALLKALMTIPVRFGKRGPERVTPILKYQGCHLKINWNYYRVLPDQGEIVARLREEFQRFLKYLVDSRRVVEFTMRDGDVVLFRDQDVLHGRRTYAARDSGDRLLWKSYYTARAFRPEAQRAGDGKPSYRIANLASHRSS
jgi:alpha-ketoglutarate-dependent taurine dioxygenase